MPSRTLYRVPGRRHNGRIALIVGFKTPKVKVLWGSSVPLGGSAPPTVICMNLDFGNHGVKTDRSLSSNVLEVVREARLSCLPRVALNCGIEAAK